MLYRSWLTILYSPTFSFVRRVDGQPSDEVPPHWNREPHRSFCSPRRIVIESGIEHSTRPIQRCLVWKKLYGGALLLEINHFKVANRKEHTQSSKQQWNSNVYCDGCRIRNVLRHLVAEICTPYLSDSRGGFRNLWMCIPICVICTWGVVFDGRHYVLFWLRVGSLCVVNCVARVSVQETSIYRWAVYLFIRKWAKKKSYVEITCNRFVCNFSM